MIGMESFVLAVLLGSLCVALGEYMLYNFIVMLAGLMHSSKTDQDFMPQLTVMIPAHNEENHIRRKL